MRYWADVSLSMSDAHAALVVRLSRINRRLAQMGSEAVPMPSFETVLVDVHSRCIAGHISWDEFCDLTDLPHLALEQLLALGAFRSSSDPVVDELFQGKQLERVAIARFLSRFLGLKAPPPGGGWVSLSNVMTGVGAREKPWGKVLLAGLAGVLPGGLPPRLVLRIGGFKLAYLPGV